MLNKSIAAHIQSTNLVQGKKKKQKTLHLHLDHSTVYINCARQRNFLQNKHKSFLCSHCWLTSDEHFVQKYAMHTKQQVVRKIKQRKGKPPALPARGYASTQIPTPRLRQKPLLSKVKPGPRPQRNPYQGGLLAANGSRCREPQPNIRCVPLFMSPWVCAAGRHLYSPTYVLARG